MKYCSHCGAEVSDEAVICMKCGCAIKSAPKPANQEASNLQDTKSNSLMVAAIVLGIVGIVVSWVFALIGHIASIVAIVLGIVALKKIGKPTGLILGIIGELCSIISSVIGVVLMSGVLYYI